METAECKIVEHWGLVAAAVEYCIAAVVVEQIAGNFVVVAVGDMVAFEEMDWLVVVQLLAVVELEASVAVGVDILTVVV